MTRFNSIYFITQGTPEGSVATKRTRTDEDSEEEPTSSSASKSAKSDVSGKVKVSLNFHSDSCR